MYNLMFRYTRHELDAADLTQDVFFKAFNRLSSYRPERSLFSWLYKLAINVANDWSRARTRIQTKIPSSETLHTPHTAHRNPAIRLEDRDQEELLEQAMESIPAETREILLLRYRHEQPIKEVAAIFGIGESAVKMRIKRGLEQLQKIMQEINTHEQGFFR
ncbi:RNA polymerase sigma factor [Desulfoprunum benzoelyticum]|nr:RNA polymerase sigma factor [Desulfoprunum benzoelyticum]